MFCFKCGKELQNECKFCPACGEKQIDLNYKEIGEISEVKSSDNISNTDNKEVPEVIGEKEIIETPEYVNNINLSDEKLTRKKSNKDFKEPKKIFKKKIALMISAVVLVIGIIALKMVWLPYNTNAYAYISNGAYGLIEDIEKEKFIQITSDEKDEDSNFWLELLAGFIGDSSEKNRANADLLMFSPSGKYIYYYVNYDGDSKVGELCRVPYRKLKEDSEENEEYIEVVSSEVKLGMQFCDDDSVVFLNSEDSLFYYNGKEIIMIQENVDNFFLDDKGRLLYGIEEGDGSTLYGVALDNANTSVKLAENVNDIKSMQDFDNIVYTKSGKDFSEDLYVVGLNREEEKIGSKVQFLGEVDGKTYFLMESGETINLYDYVEDNCKEADEKEKMPMKEDYAMPEYSYERIDGQNLLEKDFNELYTSCTHKLTWLESGKYTMEEAVDVNWDENSDEIQAVIQDFIDRFADQANEDGYILVTDEVKEALQKIQKYDWSYEDESEWLWLCYNKYQSGTKIDDAYHTAYYSWTFISNRKKLRKFLQNEDNSYKMYSLYCFDKTEVDVVKEDVVDADFYEGGIVFYTLDDFEKKLNIMNINSIEDVYNLFESNRKIENQILLTKDGSFCELSLDAQQLLGNNTSTETNLFVMDNEIYLNIGDILYYASIDNGSVGKFDKISEGVRDSAVEDSVLYYLTTNEGFSYYDLYVCSGKESTCVAEHILLENSRLYADGTILAHTSHNEDEGYELSMFNSEGEKEVIATGVKQSVRIDKKSLFYISDGDLYYYDGNGKKFVKDSIDWLWCLKAMESVYIFQ